MLPPGPHVRPQPRRGLQQLGGLGDATRKGRTSSGLLHDRLVPRAPPVRAEPQLGVALREDRRPSVGLRRRPEGFEKFSGTSRFSRTVEAAEKSFLSDLKL